MFNIAINTFKEIVRNKFLYLIVFFAFIFIIFSILLWKLTLWNDHKIIVDFGLAMIEIFWWVSVLFVWSQLLFKEVEGKTIFLILSKPIKRYEFILGKFLGFSATILLIITLQALLFLIVLYSHWTIVDEWITTMISSFFKHEHIPITSLIIWSLIFTYLKLEILLGLVFLFSTFMWNILTILTTLMVYFVSHSYSLLNDMAGNTQSKLIQFWTQWIQLLFPPLEALNTKDIIGTFNNFHVNYFIFNTFYSIVYLCIILFFTTLIFNKKTFES